MDRLEAMSILRLTAEKGSFTGAAKTLRMPLATLSRKISALEAYLGVQLLLRSTRKLTLTEAGAAYIAAAGRILEDVEEAERSAAGEYDTPKGELVITAPILFGRLYILPVVADFLAAYPQIAVRLMLSDRNMHLLDDHVDLAVRIGALPDSSLVATRIGAVRTVVCASPKLLAAHGTPKRPEDLSRLPCVTFEHLPEPTVWTFERPKGGVGASVSIAPRLSVTTAEAAIWAAGHGVGATRVFCYQSAEAVRSGAVKVVLKDFEPETAPVQLVQAARAVMPLKMRTFLDFATARLRRELAELAHVMA
jgi:DNA-binding transcriptional LysR family regulator